MSIENECKRCGIDFNEKRYLVKHLQKKVECIGINSEIRREVLIKELMYKEGIECEYCKKKYSNIYNMKKHKCKGIDNAEIKVVTNNNITNKNINSNNNITNKNIKTIDSYNTINNTQNITIIINDIDEPKGIEYILKDKKFVEKILKWVSDTNNGLLKYMNEKFYNPNRPENQGIRKVDNENIELHTLGRWIKYSNSKALELIIYSLGIDMGTLIGILKDNYSEDYDNNKSKIVKFKREIGEPLDMDLDVTDDEETEVIHKIEKINGEYILKDGKSDKMEKKRSRWNDKIIKSVY